MQKTLILITFLLFGALCGNSQIVNVVEDDPVDADSIRRAFDSGPYFGLYKDNYFIFGTPVGQKITRHNSNISPFTP